MCGEVVLNLTHYKGGDFIRNVTLKFPLAENSIHVPQRFWVNDAEWCHGYISSQDGIIVGHLGSKK